MTFLNYANILFLPEKQANRHPGEVKMSPKLVLQIVPVWGLDIVRKIAEKGKTRGMEIGRAHV